MFSDLPLIADIGADIVFVRSVPLRSEHAIMIVEGSFSASF